MEALEWNLWMHFQAEQMIECGLTSHNSINSFIDSDKKVVSAVRKV